MTYAIDNRPAKGTAVYARNLVERLLKDAEYDYIVVHYEECDDPIYRMGAREIVMPRVPAWIPAKHFCRFLLFCWRYRKERFDIVHWFQPRLYPFFWLVPAKKIIVTAHGAGDITAPGAFPFSRRMFNFVITHFNRRIDAIIAVSEFGKREIIQYYRAQPERVHVIYNGGAEEYRHIPKADARKVAQRYGVAGPFILDISRLSPHKNVGRLIEAYDLMRDQHPERTESLVIVGTPSTGSKEIYRLAAESAYTGDIQLLEYVESQDLNALYSAAEVFAFPSLNEGFGLPVIEAFASGVPVITSDGTSLPEIAGGAALLVDPTSREALADALYRALSDAHLRDSLVERGRLRARDFSWENCAAQTLALYRSALGHGVL